MEEIVVFGSIGTNLYRSVLVTVKERGRGDFNQEGKRERRVSSMEAVVSSRMERERERERESFRMGFKRDLR